MRTRAWYFPLIGIVFSVGPLLQEPSFEIELWEKRLNKRQPPVQILDAIGAAPGMVIGEVGAGTGRMTMWLAERIEKTGKVYANDIDKDHLEHLRKRCERDGFKNVEIVLGETDNPRLPAGELDMAFMINVYHHLERPISLIRNLLPSLKVDGVLAIVECDPSKVDWGEKEGCNGQKEMVRELNEAGFEVVRIDTFLNEDNIYIAKPRQPAFLIPQPRSNIPFNSLNHNNLTILCRYKEAAIQKFIFAS
jgi:SAM-dependent methyltransferase